MKLDLSFGLDIGAPTTDVYMVLRGIFFLVNIWSSLSTRPIKSEKLEEKYRYLSCKNVDKSSTQLIMSCTQTKKKRKEKIN